MFLIWILSIATFFHGSHAAFATAVDHSPVTGVYGRCPMNNPRCGK